MDIKQKIQESSSSEEWQTIDEPSYVAGLGVKGRANRDYIKYELARYERGEKNMDPKDYEFRIAKLYSDRGQRWHVQFRRKDKMDIKERIQELSLDQKAKLYFMGLVRQGKIDRLPEDPKAAYVSMMMNKDKLKETATELGYLNEEEMYGFTVKGANFTYTEQGGRFYGVYLYDVPATANTQWREKIRSADEATKWLQSLGIQEIVPRRYNEDTLDKIVMILKNKGIVADHDDFFDVS